MKMNIYHRKNILHGLNPPIPKQFPRGFDHVALVESINPTLVECENGDHNVTYIEALEDAFHKCTGVFKKDNWALNESVSWTSKVGRSITTGDVIETGDGHRFLVGFTKWIEF